MQNRSEYQYAKSAKGAELDLNLRANVLLDLVELRKSPRYFPFDHSAMAIESAMLPDAYKLATDGLPLCHPGWV